MYKTSLCNSWNALIKIPNGPDPASDLEDIKAVLISGTVKGTCHSLHKGDNMHGANKISRLTHGG